MGYILHCFNCFHREKSEGLISTLKRKCPICGSNLSVAGPLLLGKLWIKEFCISMRKLTEERKLKNQKRILKFLSLIENETNAPATYYVIDKICDKFNISVPPLAETIKALRETGFRTTRTHFNSKAFRTNAPAKVVKEIVIQLSSSHRSNLR